MLRTPISALHGIHYAPHEDAVVQHQAAADGTLLIHPDELSRALEAARRVGRNSLAPADARGLRQPRPAAHSNVAIPEGDLPGDLAFDPIGLGRYDGEPGGYASWKLGFVCLGATCAYLSAVLSAVPALKDDCAAGDAGCHNQHQMAIGQTVAAGLGIVGSFIGGVAEFVNACCRREAGAAPYASWKLGTLCLGATCAYLSAVLGAVPALKASCGVNDQSCHSRHQMAIGQVSVGTVAMFGAVAGATAEFVKACCMEPRGR